jgi:hypothetical protein
MEPSKMTFIVLKTLDTNCAIVPQLTSSFREQARMNHRITLPAAADANRNKQSKLFLETGKYFYFEPRSSAFTKCLLGLKKFLVLFVFPKQSGISIESRL